ncbi:hypothetical protein IEN85_13030 [Pelagicoccus sp. NFK12]|uniref:Sugar phosphate isomerase/epimerase n=1 Tax=Pelagicoccus enzymogenes TaxID=2773457 RepID=A0A927IFS6_9BACT|nr:hypothetical protein [Pelagicoccus enzymogenes]MBD5780417.1 hypothetical protein [Pelagicoccus enzymogenes]
MPIPQTNDGSQQPPRIELFLNAGCLVDLPPHATAPSGELRSVYSKIKDIGFAGMQDGDFELAKDVGLQIAAGARVNSPEEIEPLVEKHLSQGQIATTLHCGWGMESDAEVDAYATTVLDIATRYRYPLFIETHRATITQDNWRTVELVKRFPELRFNGDFSHWYAGLEMVNGHWDEKIDFIRPVLERVRFLHGRIADPGSIQAPLSLDPDAGYIQHFREIWNICFQGFLAAAKQGDFLVFAPELLWPQIYYARMQRQPDGSVVESGDRWADVLVIKQIALQEFEKATARCRSVLATRFP